MNLKVLVFLLLFSQVLCKTIGPRKPSNDSSSLDENEHEEPKKDEEDHEFVYNKGGTGKTTVQLLVGNPPSYIFNKYSQRGDKAYFRYTFTKSNLSK